MPETLKSQFARMLVHTQRFNYLLLLFLSFMYAEVLSQDKLLKLNENTFKFSPGETNILDPILQDIQNSDVIFMGDFDHGDGSSYDIKYQIIRQLFEKEGLSAIVFESDFFAMNHNSKQRCVKERLASTYQVWSECSQFKKILTYIIDNQIEVYGSDPRLISPYSKKNLVSYFRQYSS